MESPTITSKDLEAFTKMMQKEKEGNQAEEIKQHYEEILTSLDFTFGEIKEVAEEMLKNADLKSSSYGEQKRIKQIIGLIDSRSKY